MKRFILSALFFIALLVIWHLLVLAKIWSPVLLPDPISVWEFLKGAAADGTLLEASLVTMRRPRLWTGPFATLRPRIKCHGPGYRRYARHRRHRFASGQNRVRAVGALSPSAMGHGPSLN
jgi:hypothetical protein